MDNVSKERKIRGNLSLTCHTRIYLSGSWEELCPTQPGVTPSRCHCAVTLRQQTSKDNLHSYPCYSVILSKCLLLCLSITPSHNHNLTCFPISFRRAAAYFPAAHLAPKSPSSSFAFEEKFIGRKGSFGRGLPKPIEFTEESP